MREAPSWEDDLWMRLYLEAWTFSLEWNWDEAVLNASKPDSAWLLQGKGDRELGHQAKTEASTERILLEAKEGTKKVAKHLKRRGHLQRCSRTAFRRTESHWNICLVFSPQNCETMFCCIFCHTIVTVPKWHQQSKLVKNCPKASCITC